MKKLIEFFGFSTDSDEDVNEILEDFEIEGSEALDEDVEVLGQKLALSEDLSFDFDKYVDETVRREIAADTALTKLHQDKDTRVRKIIQKHCEHVRNRITYGRK